MKIVLLPGYDQSNIDWLAHAQYELLPNIPNKQLVHYQHWGDSSVSFNPQNELQRIVQQCGDGSETLLIAKSVGILLTLVANCNRLYRPDAAIFLGTPVKENHIDFLNESFTELVRRTDFPILFVQQLSDRLCTYANLEKMLSRCSKWNILIESITGGDHGYSQFDEIGVLTSGWFESLKKSQGV